MRLFVTLSKKSMIFILCAVITIILLLGHFFTVSSNYLNGSTNALRINYINGLGYQVKDETLYEKNITIPDKFSDVYLNYNNIQKQAGFDLAQYKGIKARIYSYQLISNESRLVNLIIYKNIIIGGDISDTNINGKMLPLKGAD